MQQRAMIVPIRTDPGPKPRRRGTASAIKSQRKAEGARMDHVKPDQNPEIKAEVLRLREECLDLLAATEHVGKQLQTLADRLKNDLADPHQADQ
jgi:hypothetical protein